MKQKNRRQTASNDCAYGFIVIFFHLETELVFEVLL